MQMTTISYLLAKNIKWRVVIIDRQKWKCTKIYYPPINKPFVWQKYKNLYSELRNKITWIGHVLLRKVLTSCLFRYIYNPSSLSNATAVVATSTRLITMELWCHQQKLPVSPYSFTKFKRAQPTVDFPNNAQLHANSQQQVIRIYTTKRLKSIRNKFYGLDPHHTRRNPIGNIQYNATLQKVWIFESLPILADHFAWWKMLSSVYCNDKMTLVNC